jgi:hypothetical protein
MLNSGDVITLDLGAPAGREAGLRRPAVVVTAQRLLDTGPSVVNVVPLTTTIRDFGNLWRSRANPIGRSGGAPARSQGLGCWPRSGIDARFPARAAGDASA